MIIYIPDKIDNIDNIEIGCLCTISHCNCLSREKKIFVDIGLRAAQSSSFSIFDYLRLIQRVFKKGAEIYAVIPDVFCNSRKTLENFNKYYKIISRYAKTVFVLQYFYVDIDIYRDVLDVVDVVALPAHKHCDVTCIARPRVCAERIERALRRLYNYKIHLLGPVIRTLRILRGTLWNIYSFDTSSYRKAPNKKAKEKLGGKWQVTDNTVATNWFIEWLKQAGIIA